MLSHINIEQPRSNRFLAQLNKLSRNPWPVTFHDGQVIRQYLKDAGKDLESYEIEIQKLKATILTLETLQTGVRKAMERYGTLLAPVHRLPSDVLLEIFGHLCERNQLDRNYRMLPAVSTLASVCSRWREVAISTPVLWSSFTIDFDYWAVYHGSDGTGTLAELTRLFLERSKTTPLDIGLSFPLDWLTELDLAPTLDLLHANSSRWRKLETFYSEWIASPRAGLLHTPNLQHLTLITRVPWENNNTTDVLDRFAGCPVLTSVHLDLEGPELMLSLPWSQLRIMHLDNCESQPAFSAITRCSNLQKLTLEGINDDRRPYVGSAIVSNTITSLSMQGDVAKGREANIALVQHLSLPNLSYFEVVNDSIHTPRQEPSYDAMHLVQFITRSRCSLTSLRLKSVSLTDTEVFSLLCLMPALENLDIGEYPGLETNRIITRTFSDHLFLDQRASDTSHATLLPRLAELKLSIHSNGLDEQALSDALTSRWAAASHSLSVVEIALIAKEKPPAGPLASLQCFSHVGLRFTLSHVPNIA
ncbi:hypothetical protein V5O48_004991 [Marasmius crinis-equi]|uniref:F-box domain-containing protein n=1 Tax=Marasmius crinis-equi TaxID=585013 RepID=A0ABR3FNI7_9AGAR